MSKCDVCFDLERDDGPYCLACLRQRITYDEGLRYLMAREFLGYFMEDGICARDFAEWLEGRDAS